MLSLSLYFTAYVQLMKRAVFLICISREGFDLVQDPGCKKMELSGLFHNKIIKTFLGIINKQIRMYNKNSSENGDVITSFPFLRKRLKFSVPFVWITSARRHVERK